MHPPKGGCRGPVTPVETDGYGPRLTPRRLIRFVAQGPVIHRPHPHRTTQRPSGCFWRAHRRSKTRSVDVRGLCQNRSVQTHTRLTGRDRARREQDTQRANGDGRTDPPGRSPGRSPGPRGSWDANTVTSTRGPPHRRPRTGRASHIDCPGTTAE